MKNFTLGLDLGANSVGWAIVNENSFRTGNKSHYGVRIFPEGTEKTTTGEQSRNLARRQARSMRRQLDRRSRRKRHLIHVLMRAGAVPTNAEAFRHWVALDPYPLRKRGLDEALAPEEFARALVHLNRRRGFKSNLKAQSEEAKDQDSIKGQIAGLQKGIEETGARTLGGYLAGLKEKGEKIRERHTSRAMYEREFDLLWARQAEFRPDLWTDALKELVYPGIFYQRPLKSQAHLIGKCPLEPGERRCARASWFAQQFRLLQTVNDLRILSRSEGETLLSTEKREALIDALMKAKDVKIEKIKGKILGLSDIESLNFERTEEAKMLGNPVEAGLRKLFKNDFDEKARWLRETVWEALLEDDPEEFHRKALNELGLSEEQITGFVQNPAPLRLFPLFAESHPESAALPGGRLQSSRCADQRGIQGNGNRNVGLSASGGFGRLPQPRSRSSVVRNEKGGQCHRSGTRRAFPDYRRTGSSDQGNDQEPPGGEPEEPPAATRTRADRRGTSGLERSGQSRHGREIQALGGMRRGLSLHGRRHRVAPTLWRLLRI
jgi:hypothetical protein